MSSFDLIYAYSHIHYISKEFQIAHYNNKLDFHFKKWEPISDQIDTFFKP